MKLVFKKPQPFWAVRVHRWRAAPAPPLRAGEGRGRPRGDRHAPRGRHRALPPRRVPAGRLHPRGDQQALPRAEPAVLRPARDQVRRRRGGGGPRGAADRRVRLRLLRAGGGGGPAAHRAGRQGPRPHDPEQRGELHPVQPDGSVARGGRRALEPQGPAPAAERAAGAHRAEPAGGPRGDPGAPGRAHRPDHRQLPDLPRALPLAEHAPGSSTSTRRTISWTRRATRAAPTESARRMAGDCAYCSRPPPTPPCRRSRWWSSSRPRARASRWR